MPTYEYRCDKGHAFEEFQSMLADPIQVCPLCGAHAERIISAGAGLIFKGSGFYATDYGRGTSQSTRKSEKAKADADSKAEAKSDSAPAADAPKTETKTETPSEPKSDKSSSKPEN
jgi:putative FmdB family regulatory protein